MTPMHTVKGRVTAARARYGEREIVAWCASLLDGWLPTDSRPTELRPSDFDLVIIGGPHAASLVASGDLGNGVHDYWPRVWAARALLYVWHPSAAPAVIAALADPAWRVREMALKVVKLRELAQAADLLFTLADDPVPRVRLAAIRAVPAIGEAEHAALLHSALTRPVSARPVSARPAVAPSGRDAEPASDAATGVASELAAAASAALRALQDRLDRPL